MSDSTGNWPEWATKFVAAVAVVAAVTVATAGAGTAVAVIAVGAAIGMVSGVAMGAMAGAVSFANRNSSVLKYTYNYKYGNVSWNSIYLTGQGGMFTSTGKILTFWYR